MLEMTEYGMRSTESVKTSFNCLFCPKDSILIRLRVFHFVPPYTCSVLNCLSQFETLHYPWIPSLDGGGGELNVLGPPLFKNGW